MWNQVARACGVLKEFDAGAAATERYLNFILRTENVAFVEGTAYAAVPMAVTAFRARGLLAAGQVDAAVTAAKEHHAVLPGYTDLVTALVPELEKLGRRTDADGTRHRR